MRNNNVSTEPLYLGIDGGGSKCRASLYSADSRLMGTGVAGAANPFQKMEQAQESILCSARLALNDAGSAASPSRQWERWSYAIGYRHRLTAIRLLQQRVAEEVQNNQDAQGSCEERHRDLDRSGGSPV